MLVFIHFLLDKFHVGYEGESGMDVSILTVVTDTLDHRISGFSQQQAAGESLTFTSQHGSVEVASLPIVIGQGTEAPARPVSAEGSVARAGILAELSSSMGGDIFNDIERLADLQAKGILSFEEFSSKKK